jgi:hypothetical protein
MERERVEWKYLNDKLLVSFCLVHVQQNSSPVNTVNSSSSASLES